MWDFGQYNLVVKQVEGCSDILRDIEARISRDTFKTKIAERMGKHLLQAARELDKRALRMLAMYDPAAREMVRTGVDYDPRRDMFRRKKDAANPPHDAKPLWCSDEEARAAAESATPTKKGTR